MSADVIPLPGPKCRRRVVRRELAPVVELAPVLAERRRRERLDELAILVGEAMTEYRRLKGKGPLPPGPGNAVAL
jgi:hypothetical protein